MATTASLPRSSHMGVVSARLGEAWHKAMLIGDYEAAWRVSDQVLAARNPATRDDPSLPYHLRWVWSGTDLRQRHVLVRCYHGLGDTLQFARYLAPLRQLAAFVTLEAQPELCPLLKDIEGVDRVLPFLHHAPAQSHDIDIEIMELPHALRLPPAAVQPPRLAVATQPAISAIGLCWQAGDWDSLRSMPENLLTGAVAGHRLASLQPGQTVPGADAIGCPATITETAAMVARLSLVVTVDTMVAHLAGTLGRPCWLLLHHDADWRWMRNRSDTPWYPTMRLFRQPTPGGWEALATQLAA